MLQWRETSARPLDAPAPREAPPTAPSGSSVPSWPREARTEVRKRTSRRVRIAVAVIATAAVTGALASYFVFFGNQPARRSTTINITGCYTNGNLPGGHSIVNFGSVNKTVQLEIRFTVLNGTPVYAILILNDVAYPPGPARLSGALSAGLTQVDTVVAVDFVTDPPVGPDCTAVRSIVLVSWEFSTRVTL